MSKSSLSGFLIVLNFQRKTQPGFLWAGFCVWHSVMMVTTLHSKNECFFESVSVSRAITCSFASRVVSFIPRELAFSKHQVARQKSQLFGSVSFFASSTAFRYDRHFIPIWLNLLVSVYDYRERHVKGGEGGGRRLVSFL